MLHQYLEIFKHCTQYILIPLITFGIVTNQEHKWVKMVEVHWFWGKKRLKISALYHSKPMCMIEYPLLYECNRRIYTIFLYFQR
jgi:hypothetical protein